MDYQYPPEDLSLKGKRSNSYRSQIASLLHQLAIAYYNTQQDRKRLALSFPSSPGESAIVEEIEQLTVNIRAYGSQLQSRGWLRDEEDAIAQLQNLRVFDSPHIAQFYFGSREDYQQIKTYLHMLDYLRLVILEYLHFHQD
jgi:hypothetical protein